MKVENNDRREQNITIDEDNFAFCKKIAQHIEVLYIKYFILVEKNCIITGYIVSTEE
jgi:hypothetical protein